MFKFNKRTRITDNKWVVDVTILHTKLRKQICIKATINYDENEMIEAYRTTRDMQYMHSLIDILLSRIYKKNSSIEFGNVTNVNSGNVIQDISTKFNQIVAYNNNSNNDEDGNNNASNLLQQLQRILREQHKPNDPHIKEKLLSLLADHNNYYNNSYSSSLSKLTSSSSLGSLSNHPTINRLLVELEQKERQAKTDEEKEKYLVRHSNHCVKM